MKVFSRVVATLDNEFTVWLPPRDELSSFIEQLSGFEVDAIEKDGELSLCGTLEAINSVEDCLCAFVQDKEEEDEEATDSEDPAVADEEDSEASIEAEKDEQSSRLLLQESNMDSTGDDEVNQDTETDDCLNIEVFHPEIPKDGLKKPYKFSCLLCSFKTQRDSHYQRHLALHQKTDTIYRCSSCSYSTLRFIHLRRHQVIHSTQTLSCPSCSYNTDDPKLLARHQRAKHKEDSNNEDKSVSVTYQCPACPYQTTREHLYERHMRVHTAEASKGGPNLHICSLCGYRTTRKIHFSRHVRDVHRAARPYLCHRCGKAFKRPDALKQHSLMHAATDGLVDARMAAFQCPLCGKLCHSKAHLKEHQTVHSSERSFLCEICGAGFKSRSGQRKHIANLHETPRAFACSICNKRFNTNYALRRHTKTHPIGEAVDVTSNMHSDAIGPDKDDDAPVIIQPRPVLPYSSGSPDSSSTEHKLNLPGC